LSNKRKLFAYLSIIGSTIFVGIILFLHFVQSHYDFMNQYMSELAMGQYGDLMLVAFCCFAISIFSVSEILRMFGAPVFLSALFVIASICFIGAGVITLDQNATLHIMFVMIASVLILLGMILSPLFIVEFRIMTYKAVSWCLGFFAILFLILNQYCITDGIAQRATAGCILIWLIWIGIKALQFNHKLPNKANSADAKSRAAD